MSYQPLPSVITILKSPDFEISVLTIFPLLGNQRPVKLILFWLKIVLVGFSEDSLVNFKFQVTIMLLK